MKQMEVLTTRKVLLRVAVIVAVAEGFIMLVLQTIPAQASNYSLAALDVALLAAMTTPPIYLWVIKPFVEARDAALAELNQLASTDPLTQLANRRALFKHLQNVIAGSVKHKIPAAVLVIDLDGFKQINDVHGHDIGDAVLVETAKRIRSVTRTEDVASRLGGDEFVLILNRLDSDKQLAAGGAVRTAEKLVKLVNSPIVIDDRTLNVDASIGIRLLGFDDLDSKAALGEADAAMYRAKQAGRGRAVLFEK
jgi:diguanylate cyclase (GGDEF)-like protein